MRSTRHSPTHLAAEVKSQFPYWLLLLLLLLLPLLLPLLLLPLLIHC
jgi:hypothetical protein